MPVLELNPDTGSHDSYFHREDWCSFAVAMVVVFIGYWFSLANNLGLGFSGIYSVGASYVGVPHPPGYPLWTLYGWLFTKLLPFSNIAWRLAISSAVAGALACGVIALMTCRSSATLLAGAKGLQPLAPRDDRLLRMGVGVVAGMTFGFDRAFWRKAVIVDVWPLSILLFAVTLCLLMRWAHQPERKRFLITACFAFGLAITNSQALIPAGLGLLFFVALADKPTGRDAALIASVLLAFLWLGRSLDFFPGYASSHRCGSAQEIGLILSVVTVSTVALYLGLAIGTRQWSPNWKILLATPAFFVGLGFNLLVPVFSMTNPPMNWGYARNLEGFLHVMNRDQYESIYPVLDVCVYLRQLLEFGRCALKDFGVLPVLLALIPIGFLFRFSSAMRGFVLGSLTVFTSMSMLLVALLNPSPDRQSSELIASYYTPSHLVLAVLLGHGLVVVGTLLLRPRKVDSIAKVVVNERA
jgi:hypothetical protein